MNAKEAVRALRNCKAYKTKSDLQITMIRAADLIESLQAENERFKSTLAREGFADIETMIAKYKTVILAANELSIEDDEEMERLRTKLAESQARERDARNELCLKCGKYRESHNGACDGCRWRGEKGEKG